MTFLTFFLKSIRYHRRLYVGLFLAVIVTSAIITGALLVGDSLTHTLQSLSHQRLGSVQVVISTQDRFFRQDLAMRMENLAQIRGTSVVRINGIAINSELSKQAPKVNVYGVESEFWKFGRSENPFDHTDDEVVVNQKLANKLGVSVGDQILIRFELPGLLVKDSALASTENSIDAKRFTVSRILTAAAFGNFGLEANQRVPDNIFLPLNLLQNYLNKIGEANLLIVGDDRGNTLSADDVKTVFDQVWQLDDLGLTLNEYTQKGVVELQSNRVFIDDSIERAASNLTPNRKMFTYFVNAIRKGEATTPYSMVAAVDTRSHEFPNSADDWSQFPLTDQSIILNQWCADDLDATVGDSIVLSYLIPDKRGTYKELETEFTLKSILPTRHSSIDQTLTPAYPGLVDAENCREWDAGIAIELDKIRTKDEVYWDTYGATPKAVISLGKGQEIWQNRFGHITAIRYPLNMGTKADIERQLRDVIKPEEVGFNFRSARIDAINAASGSTDFSGLFIGLSFFIIVSALLLTGLLFAFGIEYKSKEQGTLRALGFRPIHIKVQYLIESALVSVPAACIGSYLGLGYTKFILHGLATLWRDAIVRTPLLFHYEMSSLIIGVMSSVFLTIIVVVISLNTALKQPVILLLNRCAYAASRISSGSGKKSAMMWVSIGLAMAATAFVFIVAAKNGRIQESTGFFIASVIVLVACLSFSGSLLIWVEKFAQSIPDLLWVAIRNMARHKGRSLAIIAILACAVFLLAALETQKISGSNIQSYIDAGTGGFALMGEATHPIYDPVTEFLPSVEGIDFDTVKLVRLRMVDGDDASCLNLNRAQQPGIVGINPETFARLSLFKFKSFYREKNTHNPWALVSQEIDDNTIPVIADFNTMTYALGKKLGDVIRVQTEDGTPLALQFVATLENSILQGKLLIDERQVKRHFPSNAGYRMFLVKSDESLKSLVSNAMNDSFQDHGLEMINTVDRLHELNQVQNTYISIFQILGGLGILLGSAGLGIVIFRHAQERQSEFAIMKSMGFRNISIQWMLVHEHCILIALGTLNGMFAAFIALFPRLSNQAASISLTPIILLFVGIVVNNFLWIWFASFFTLRQDTLRTLRRE